MQNKTVGIWGYGRVGQSATQLCERLGASILVYDADNNVLRQCPYTITQSVNELLEKSDVIIPSPGVDISPYKKKYAKKWLAELDLFQSLFHKKIIAITGTVGKTSVTHMLTQMLTAAGWRVQAAGNIGTPMLDMIEKQSELDAIILEVSSFQLEHTRIFAPDLAIWTNFHPNHLDRHATIQQYFIAKSQIIAHQLSSQNALIPVELHNHNALQNPKSHITYFNPKQLPQHHFSGFPVNWLIVEKVLELLYVPLPPSISITPLAHRLESVCVINGTRIINDSKSTTPASTLAALTTINTSRVLLFLGGLSKGIDRSELIASLPNNVSVLCFGSEAKQLFSLCNQYSICATMHSAMVDAIVHCMNIIQPEDTVLFSPSGSSFDEFKNFEDRGNQFKKEILSYKNKFDCQKCP